MSSLRKWDILRLALAIAGAGVMVYLTVVHYAGNNLLACPSGGTVNCEKVINAPESEFFGIPVSLFGLAWFIAAGAAAVWSLRGAPPWLAKASLLWTSAGIAFVLYFIYVELAVVHAICLWCTVAHVIIFVMLVIEALTFSRRTADTEEEGEVSLPPSSRSGKAAR